MYKVITVGEKVIYTTNSSIVARIIANNFANTNCTFAKVYCGDTLIAIYS